MRRMRSRLAWKCQGDGASEFPRGRFRHLRGRRPPDAALIELQAFPSLYGFRTVFPRLPASGTTSGDPARLDLVVWRAEGRRLRRDSAEGDRRRRGSGERHSARDRAREAKDPDRFRLHRDAAGRAAGLPDEARKRGAQLFYERDGREVRIERIYNRVIFDELIRRPDLNPPFRFQDELDVKWVGHPNWYFRISKHSLPFLKTEHTAPAFFADEFPEGESIDRLRP